MEDGDFIYWWDIGISPSIYILRLLFLFSNMILIVLVLWTALWWLLSLNKLVRKCNVKPFYCDPQGAFGLRPFANLLAIMVVPWFIALMIGLVGWLDHRGQQGIANLAGTVLLGIGAIYGIYLILRPLYLVHKQLRVVRLEALVGLEAELSAVEQMLATGLPTATSGSFAARVNDGWPTVELLNHIGTSQTWPVPGPFGIPIIAGLVAPFLGTIGVSFISLVDWMTTVARWEL